MIGKNKRVLSEWAPFVEEYLQSIQRINRSIQRIENDASCCTNEDERGDMLLQSYEWQYMVLALQNKIEEIRLTAKENETFADSF